MLVWIGLAGALAVLELLTGTFYILMAAVGALAGAALAYFGVSLPVQIIVAAVVSVAAMYVVHYWRKRNADEPKSADKNPDINIDIGQTLLVQGWQGNKARSTYRGAMWDIELASEGTPTDGGYRIIAVRGSTLIVEKL